jgi:hypothetical protein
MQHEHNLRTGQEPSGTVASDADESMFGIPMGRAVRATTAVVGAASLIGGAFAVFETENGVGSAALLAIGALLFILAGVGVWPQNLKVGETSVQFPGRKVMSIADGAEEHGDTQTAAELYRLASRVADEQGDWKAAKDLDDRAARLDATATSIASEYEDIRASAAPSLRRTTSMEALVAAAREAATKDPKFNKDDIRKRFMEGGAGARVFALAVMQADPDVRDFDVLLDAISHSKSAFEQYHALLLAQKMLTDNALDEAQQHALASVIETQRRPGGYIIPGSDRWALSEAILTKIR